MRRRFRPPMFVIAAALVGLMALLATLQYQWLGRVSAAERDSRRSTLSARTAAFALDFDRELTLAYLLFQFDPAPGPDGSSDGLAARLGARYERWQSTARYPRLVKDYYVASRDERGAAHLQRFNPSTRFVEPAAWPEALRDLRGQLAASPGETIGGSQASARGGSRRDSATFIVRTMAAPLREDIPALIVPMPVVLFDPPQALEGVRFSAMVSYTVLVIDREYVMRDMLPALAAQHFHGISDGFDYQVAVVDAAGRGILYHSTAAFEPTPDAIVDAAADLFQIRLQEFPQLVADIRRFTAFAQPPSGRHTITTFTAPRTGSTGGEGKRQLIIRENKPMSLIVEQTATLRERAVGGSAGASIARMNTPAGWRVMVKHPSGSLEAAVASTRRRNLLISSSVLAVLGASMALLLLSTRRSQQVARQQMEFVAAVSHELRTPLAVIRSAGDNLADGVVGDPEGIRKYGELVRSEGRRLSEMVEQILEFAGIQSGQRRFEPKPVDMPALIQDVLAASAALLDGARIEVETDIADNLPPVLGDEAALRRVFQNLVGNAIKYGAEGRWIGVRARTAESEVRITVADRGIGIPPSEQTKIFEPFYRATDVVAAQIQGAGLGLSLVERIVEAHGGRIVLQSAPGVGSEFVVHLPAAGPEQVASAEPRATEAPRYT